MRVLVCLSGTLCNEKLWESQQNALQRHYQCLFPSISTHSNIKDLAQYILKGLPKSFCLAGMSAGAVVALEILRQTEQYSEKHIEKLVLIATNPHALTDDLKNGMLQSIETIHQIGMKRFFYETLLPQSLSLTNQNNDQIKSLIVEMAKDVGIQAYQNQVAMLNTRSDSLELLAKTNVPILAVCGQEDHKCPPAYHEAIAQNATHCQLVILENTGHYINLENPKLLNDAMLQFLNKSYKNCETKI